MADQGQTVDVQLLPSNQQAPSTSAPAGRLTSVINGVAKKFQGNGPGESLRIEKRNGWLQLTTAARDVHTAQTVTAGFASPNLLTSIGSELVVVDGVTTKILAEDAQAWSCFNNQTYSTSQLHTSTVYAQNTQIAIPDGTNLNGVYGYTWYDTNAQFTYFYVVDSDGTPVCQPQQIEISKAIAKIVSDGVYFWVITMTQNATSTGVVNAYVFDQHGAFIAYKLVAHLGDGHVTDFDLVYDPTWGVVVSRADNGLIIHRLSISGTTISEATTDLTSSTVTCDVSSIFSNFSADGNLYVGVQSNDGPGSTLREHLYKLSTPASPAVAQHWVLYNFDGIPGSHTRIMCGFTGVKWTDGNVYVYIGFAGLNGAPPAPYTIANGGLNCTVPIVATPGGSVSASPTIWHIIPSSRIFVMDGRPVIAEYYPSVVPTFFNNTQLFDQPTYFLYDVILNNQMIGAFDHGNAGQSWFYQASMYDANNIAITFLNFLPHVFVDPSYSSTHIPLTVDGEQAVTNIATNSDIVSTITELVSTIGLQDVAISGHGQALDYAGELFIPGPMATDYAGYSISEQGIVLAPEAMTGASVHTSTGGTHLVNGGTYSYVAVYEATDPNGNRVFSAVSNVSTFTVTGGSPANNGIQLGGHNLFQTRRSNLMISIYRTIWDSGSGTQGTQFHKVTSDLAPTYNDQSSPNFTFSDFMPDSAAAETEVLYTSTLGSLEHDACPAFHTGCVMDNRVIVAAYDGNVYFSGELQQGLAAWFTSGQGLGFFAMPTNDPIVNLVPMDGRLIIICKNSIWELPGGGWPDANGANGNLKTPTILPFTQGGTGFAKLITGGVVYSSNSGGLWMVTRGLESQFWSAPVVDQMQLIGGLAIDANQRLMVLNNQNQSMIWDDVANIWTTWLQPSNNVLCHSINGRLVYVDSTYAWEQVSGLYQDVGFGGGALAILTKIQTDYIAIGGVKNFNRIWDQIISGDYLGPHTLSVTTVSDSNGQSLSGNYTFVPDPSAPYQYSLPPAVEECSRVSFLFEDSFPGIGSPGNSFALELISFYIQVSPGLTRLPISSRITPTTYTVSGVFTGATVTAGMVLRLNGAQDLIIAPGATTWTFPKGLPGGTGYRVAVKSQPSGHVATPPPNGTVGVANVTGLVINVV